MSLALEVHDHDALVVAVLRELAEPVDRQWTRRGLSERRSIGSKRSVSPLNGEDRRDLSRLLEDCPAHVDPVAEAVLWRRWHATCVTSRLPKDALLSFSNWLKRAKARPVPHSVTQLSTPNNVVSLNNRANSISIWRPIGEPLWDEAVEDALHDLTLAEKVKAQRIVADVMKVHIVDTSIVAVLSTIPPEDAEYLSSHIKRFLSRKWMNVTFIREF